MISGLLGLILWLRLPALGPFPFGRRRAYSRDQEVVAEIERLSSAINAFAAQYGTIPPSGIILYENSEGWYLDPQNRAAIRRLWPQFDFKLDRDFNNDGDMQDVHTLTGAECLVFFLEVVRDRTGQPIRFSEEPNNQPTTKPTNLLDRFFQFDVARFTDVDGNGFCEYGDLFSETPYLYASRFHGRYRDADLAVYPDGDRANMLHVYDTPVLREEYQIISAGEDGEYGTGGIYPGDASDFDSSRQDESDNVTSFAPFRR